MALYDEQSSAIARFKPLIINLKQSVRRGIYEGRTAKGDDRKMLISDCARVDENEN